MPSPSFWLAAAVLALLLFYAPSAKPKSRPHRVGKDPGRFNLRTWLARIDFLRNGQELIEQSYRQVST